MTIDEIVEFLSWLEKVFPDQIKFGSKYISNSEAKVQLAKSYVEIKERNK